jgi:hypothetical protein
MIKWPARCEQCGGEIEDWAAAGLAGAAWVHKRCWTEAYREAQAQGRELPALRSPVERGSQLELPMAVFMLMFHFGLAAAVAGWFLLTQTEESETAGILLVVFGIIVPLLGAAGAALNVVGRRRIEMIRHELDVQGGWKPGR